MRQSLHLLALWGVAVAQPLFDLIGRNPAFLTAHQFGRLEVVLLALGLAVVLPTVPALAVASIGMVNRRAGEIAHSGLMGALVALLVMQGLWRAVAWPEPLVTSIAIAAALVSISGYRRYAGVRSFLSLLSPTVLLFPALFLFASPAARLLDATDTAEPRNVVQKRLPHIVFLIFDELPTTVLMDQHGGIDGEKFPHFAGLAESAYWFRNATTVHTRTEHAVPAILTGMMPKLDRVRVPTVSDFPDNLFTWAARDYRILASEPLTDLCPIRVCRVDIGLGVPANRTQRVLRDLATV
ncbi:MAG: LTA synthase family protein, partial [Gammaproteobacteria bacterium]|nr:LTA synthase family protein [Gammaproteobacteria bacterium]